MCTLRRNRVNCTFKTITKRNCYGLKKRNVTEKKTKSANMFIFNLDVDKIRNLSFSCNKTRYLISMLSATPAVFKKKLGPCLIKSKLFSTQKDIIHNFKMASTCSKSLGFMQKQIVCAVVFYVGQLC